MKINLKLFLLRSYLHLYLLKKKYGNLKINCYYINEFILYTLKMGRRYLGGLQASRERRKESIAEYQRQYYQKNKQKRKEYSTRWQKENKERYLEYQNDYYQKNNVRIQKVRRERLLTRDQE